MPHRDDQSRSSSDSDDSNLGVMHARICDDSDEEFTSNRRKRITRGRGVNKIRERSLTPTRKVEEQEVPSARKEGKTDDKDEPPQHVQLKIQSRKVPSLKVEDTQNSAVVATTKSNGLSNNEGGNDDESQFVGSVKDEEKHEVLATHDPRFVPKATRFYMHDTDRTPLKARTPFVDDEEENVISTEGDVFEPTKSGK